MIVEGRAVSVTCFAVTKTKPVIFEWLKDGERLSGNEENVKINTVNEISALVLDPVTVKDNGNYTCSAANINGKDKYTSELHVKGKNYSVCLPLFNAQVFFKWNIRDVNKLYNNRSGD